MPRRHPYSSWSQYHDVGHSRGIEGISSREYWAWLDVMPKEMRDAINNALNGPDYKALAHAIHRDHPELWQKAKKCLGYQ